MRVPAVRPAALLATLIPLVSVACAGGDDPTTEPGDTPSSASGFVFKGPLVEGSEVEWELLDANAEETGEEGETYITNHLGDYTLAMPREGFLRVEAEGAFFDESTGGLKEVPIQLATYARIEPGQDADVQINLLTDLIADRMLARLLAGDAYDDALDELQGELHAALQIGLGDAPHARPHETSPWGSNYEQSYLLAVSAVLARAGENGRVDGTGDIDLLLEEIRIDFADDGRLAPALVDRLHAAEASLDPDLATTSLRMLIADVGDDRVVADPHVVLDTDGDGIVNADDACRYVADPGQEGPADVPWGDACDDRLLAIDTAPELGCGVRATDGRLVCWDTTLGDFGGTAPHPRIKPVGMVVPWATTDGLTGRYVDVSVDTHQICAVHEDGPIECWSPALGRFSMAGDFVRVEASRNRVCGVDLDDRVSCADATGALVLTEAGPVRDLALVGGDTLVIVDDDGRLAWLDVGAGPGAASLPAGTFDSVASGGAAYDASPWACALSSAGAVACFGDHALAAGAPTADGFHDLAIGDGVACVQAGVGAPVCWRAEGTCPEVEVAPDGLTELTAEGCQVCGLDADGFGSCWPRRWYGERISYAGL